MNRFLVAALLVSATLVSTPAVAAQASVDSRGPVTRSVFCGEMCIQGTLRASVSSALFIDGEDELALVNSKGITVMSTATQKVVKSLKMPKGVYPARFELSQNNDWALLLRSDQKLFVIDTSDWSLTDVTPVGLHEHTIAIAVSNSGTDFYTANIIVGNDLCHYTASGLDECVTTPGAVGTIVVSRDDSRLYVGLRVTDNAIRRYTANDLAAGPAAQSDNTSVDSVVSIAESGTGKIVAGNIFTLNYVQGDPFPLYIRANSTTLAAESSFEQTHRWDVPAVTIDSTDTYAYAMSWNSWLDGVPLDAKLRRPLLSDFSNVQTLDFPNTAGQYPNGVDVTESGRYLVTAIGDKAYIVTLDDSTETPRVHASFSDTSTDVTWDYEYLNPAAKFVRFEVQYYLDNATRPTTAKVTKGTSYTIRGRVDPDQRIAVRAVYSKKTFTSAWGDTPIIP